MTGPLVAVVGATATGKSDLAVALAERFDGEIVNADSMQLYRGMDIGTAKLSPEQRRGVPHHLLDVWDVRTSANVAEFRGMALGAIADIHARGRLPIVVGGSGLYVRAVLDRMEFPGHDPQVRTRLEAELVALGPAALHARLTAQDPAAAASIEPGNGRRIVRALEVGEITGSPFRAQLPAPDPRFRHVTIGLQTSRPQLDELLAARVERMWRDGFVEEVRTLSGLRGSPTASRALGYRQILDFLAGETTEDEARSDTIRATRKFARRQEAWFRRDPDIAWLASADRDVLDAATATIMAAAVLTAP